MWIKLGCGIFEKMINKIVLLENHKHRYVTIKFNCPKCNVVVMSDILSLPHVILDLQDKRSQNTHYTAESCLFCRNHYQIMIESNEDKTYLKIDEIPEEWEVTIVEAESDMDFVKDHIDQTITTL